ncbi:hypothetical protein ABIB25_005481 [Nakamurella sp. UYEF19]|uniref:hypothetical protein n=1 Tax=Nakamurella sp. UYEF19 TaxID=1756392 RepID=UPI003396C12B
MHRSTPWWLVSGVIVAVIASACTSTSGVAKSSAQVSGGAITSSSAAGSGSAVSSAAPAANVFSCPTAANINALTAMQFAAAVGNGSGHCEYVVTTGSTQAARVTIDHPPASATTANETLPQFQAAVAAAGNVVLTTAPQYSSQAFIAQFGNLSCSVFALAVDGQVMQVQASHRSPATVDDCSLAQSATALTGTATIAVAPKSATTPDSGSVPSSQVPASQSPVVGTPTPVTTAPAASLPTPTPSTGRVATTAPPTTSKPAGTPTSPSEVLIFSTGPAVSLTLPTPRTTATSR